MASSNSLQPLPEITTAVVKELLRGQKGESTSYPFIRHTIATSSLVRPGETFQALVIGGSVYRSAILRNDPDQFTVIKNDAGAQPTLDTEETFLRFIADHIDPSISVIGINFAYALTPVFESGRLDGLMVGGNMKGNMFAGLEGKPVGKTIEEYLKSTRNQIVTVSVANDTICLLLSGLTQYPWNIVAAGIVGTGMNFALFLNEKTLVNLEAAHFDKFIPTPEAQSIDEHSTNKGRALTEKEIAGAYLHLLFNETIKQKGISHQPLTQASDLDAVVQDETGPAADVAKTLLDRSAQLVAAQIAGITTFLDRDTAFVMEGSLFWKGYQYRETVSRYVKQLIPQFSVSYINIPESGIMGAAKLVA